MNEQHPTNKDLYKLVQEHTIHDDVRLAQLATKEDVSDLCTKVDMLTDKIQPLIDLLSILNSLNRFLKWGGITFFAFLALMYFLIKR